MIPGIAHPSWLETGILLAIAVGAGLTVFALTLLVMRLMERSARKSAAKWDDTFMRMLDPALPLACALFVLAAAAKAAEDAMLPQARTWSHAVIVTAWFFVAALGASRLARAVSERHIAKHPQRQPLAHALERAAIGVIYGVAALVVMSSLGIQVAPVLASLGIGGIAVALALQDSLANFFAGLWIRSTKDIRRGHFIRLEDGGYEGHVDRMGWRTTRLRSRTKAMLIVPNSILSKTVITNFHLPDTKTTVDISVNTAWDSDLPAVEKALIEAALAAAEDVRGVLTDPSPHVKLDMGKKGLRWTVRVAVADITLRSDLRNAVYRRVLPRLHDLGVTFTEP